MRWRLIAAVLLILVGVGAVVLVVIGPAAGSGQDTQYLTATATRTNVVQQAVATGSVSASASYSLSFGSAPQLSNDSTSSNGSTGSGGSDGSWPVVSVKVKPGDVVRRGQILATADTTDLRRQYAAADASYNAARYQRLVAQSALDDASTTAATRQATINLYNAEAQLAQAAQTRADLKAQLAHGSLVAPSAGVVTAVNVSPGLPAPSGAAIEIDALPLAITANAAESDLPALKLGQAATATISALNRSLRGKVTGITPVATTSGTSSVVTYAVTVALDQPPAELRSGMSAEVSIATASATGVIAVPAIALNGSAGNYFVRVMAESGTVETRGVEVGLVTSSLAEIKSGLNAGEEVVTGTASARQNAQSGGFGGGFGGPLGRGQTQGGQRPGDGGRVVVPAP